MTVKLTEADRAELVGKAGLPDFTNEVANEQIAKGPAILRTYQANLGAGKTVVVTK